MREENIYIPLWEKYRPAIVSKMKLAVDGTQEYQLSRHEFEAIGQRLNAGYSFYLEIVEGRAVNNIEGTAVARDLFDVLNHSPSAKELLYNNDYKITLSTDFLLKIRIIR